MRLEEFALLASDTARSKAYLQAMIRADRLPAICILYSDNIQGLQEEAERYQDTGKKEEYFDIEIPLLYSIKKADIAYYLVESKDINSQIMKECICKLTQKYLIYSGFGGYILKPYLFHLGKRWIHIHAGVLPEYRGSTTVYYSFLQEEVIGATAIFLNEGIDEGEIIVSDTFQIPAHNVNIDYIYEPYTRAQLLLKVLEQYIKEGNLVSHRQNAENARTYYIIHPVLKHLALLKLENIYKKEDL